MIAPSFWSVVAAGAIPLGTPVAMAALGEIVLEEAGLFNVGIEGVMLLGAATGVLAALRGGAWLGLAAGAACGAVAGGGFGLTVIKGKVEPVIAGIVLDILGGGLSTLFYQLLAPAGTINRAAPVLSPIAGSPVNDLPLAGPILATMGPLFPALCVAALFLRWALRRTRTGLRIHAAGNAPDAALMRGVPVERIRFAASVIAGAAAGLAGASVPLGGIGTFTPNMTGGAGFVALAVTIVGRRDPFAVLASAFVFALFGSLALLSQVHDIGLPVELCQALPYVVTLLLLCLTGAWRRYRQFLISRAGRRSLPQ